MHETGTRRGTHQPHPERLHLVLGRGVVVSVRVVSVLRTRAVFTTTKLYARHRIEFCHVADKVHILCLDSGHAHDELGADVEHGEEHDREVVGHERDGGPVTREEDFPTAELEEQMVGGRSLVGAGGVRHGKWLASVNAVVTRKNEKHARRARTRTHRHTTIRYMAALWGRMGAFSCQCPVLSFPYRT